MHLMELATHDESNTRCWKAWEGKERQHEVHSQKQLTDTKGNRPQGEEPRTQSAGRIPLQLMALATEDITWPL